jgi:hypothetical protein
MVDHRGSSERTGGSFQRTGGSSRSLHRSSEDTGSCSGRHRVAPMRTEVRRNASHVLHEHREAAPGRLLFTRTHREVAPRTPEVAQGAREVRRNAPELVRGPVNDAPSLRSVIRCTSRNLRCAGRNLACRARKYAGFRTRFGLSGMNELSAPASSPTDSQKHAPPMGARPSHRSRFDARSTSSRRTLIDARSAPTFITGWPGFSRTRGSCDTTATIVPPMQRVLVIGASGSGKTTFARSLAARLVEWRVVRRSLARWVRRTELYNGNREPSPLGWFDPEHPVRWSWKKHGEYRVRYADRFADPAWARVTRVRLRSRAEVSAFISASPATEPGRG